MRRQTIAISMARCGSRDGSEGSGRPARGRGEKIVGRPNGNGASPSRRLTHPAEAGMSGVEDLRLVTDDGETLVAWHVPPRNGHPLILYFHGNGGALVDRVPPVPTVLSQNVVAVAAQAGTFVPHL